MTTRVFRLAATPPYAIIGGGTGAPQTPHQRDQRDQVPANEQTSTLLPVTNDGLAEWFASSPETKRSLPDYIIGTFCQRVHSTHTSTIEFERDGILQWTSSCGAAGALTDEPDPGLAWCSACWDLDNGHQFARGNDGITRCVLAGCGQRKIDLVDPVTRWCRHCPGGTQ
jgi:hypothetical protein